MLEIEKNIPIPAKYQGGKTMASEILSTLKVMEVGDSIILKENEYHIMLTVKRLLGEPNKRFVARVTEKKGNIYRVFRTE